MDDARCRQFFSQPTNPYHRRYEALRAVFVEGRAQQEVAEQFGFEYSSLRQVVYEFRRQSREAAEASPFFANGRSAGRPRRRRLPTRPPRKKRPTSRTAGSWSCRRPIRCG